MTTSIIEKIEQYKITHKSRLIAVAGILAAIFAIHTANLTLQFTPEQSTVVGLVLILILLKVKAKTILLGGVCLLTIMILAILFNQPDTADKLGIPTIGVLIIGITYSLLTEFRQKPNNGSHV